MRAPKLLKKKLSDIRILLWDGKNVVVLHTLCACLKMWALYASQKQKITTRAVTLQVTSAYNDWALPVSTRIPV